MRLCCFLDNTAGFGLEPCGKPAEYEIVSGIRCEDRLDSCLEHIPSLMTDVDTHLIFTIRQSADPKPVDAVAAPVVEEAGAFTREAYRNIVFDEPHHRKDFLNTPPHDL